MHSLLQQELARVRQDQLRREAEPGRRGTAERPANIRWLRRFVVVEETRCCDEGTPSW